jgi:hypothetical protein
MPKPKVNKLPSSKSDFVHYVLTRFNVRENPDSKSIPSDDWHEKRFLLFERYCYPAMMNQKNLKFTWLVFFDILTPEKYVKKIKAYSKFKNFRAVFVDNSSAENFKSIVDNNMRSNCKYIITTRLDNDDSVRNDFIDIIQNEFHHQACEFVNIKHGYILCDNKIYLTWDKSGPFISLIEKRENTQTVWCRQHRMVSEVGPIRQIFNEPAWIQVIHSSNSRNRVKGLRLKSENILKSYMFDTSQIGKNDHGFGFMIDKSFGNIWRLLREFLIDLIKTAIGKK